MSLPLPEQPSRNRSDSIGGSGLPEHEHKRPRLSQGQGKSQKVLTVTTDDENKSSSSQPANPSSSSSGRVTSALASPPQSPLPATATPDATSPTSRVTINTRPISSQSAMMDAPSESVSGVMKPMGPNKTGATLPQTSTPVTRNVHPDTISISSSECGSPIIQIAIPEDLDQDAADTQWEPISDLATSDHAPIRPGHVQRTFPYTSQPTRLSAQAVVMQVSKVFLEGAGNDVEIFQKVKAWLIDFANNASGLDYDFFDEDRDFWIKFPSMAISLLKRKAEPPADLEIRDLADFFVAYARITTLVVEADTENLRSYSDVTDARAIVSPYSLTYLPQLQWMVLSENIPLYETIQESLNYSPSIITEMIMDQLLGSHALKHIRSSIALFEAMADLLLKRPGFFELSLNLVAHAGGFLHALVERANSMSMEPADVNDRSSDLLSASFDFLQSINAVLDRAITKQQPWLNIETCEKMFKVVSPFVSTLAMTFPQLATDLLLSTNVKSTDFEDAELAPLAATAWRFSTLQKFIKKGRMEVRVTCVQIMAQDLVDIYHDHIRNFKELEHARVRFMIHLIRENDIVRYIIGVDSHPQIIERCANIIGFLCVSHNYCNEDTDAIWQTVLESQDPRAVVALLGVFQHNLEHLDVNVLCHIGHKLHSLPFERLDVHMLDFVMRLVSTLSNKTARDYASAEDETEVGECVIRICLKMIRDASTPDHACTELSARVRSQIQSVLGQTIKHMRGKLRLGNRTDLMRPMFVELCDDIRTHSKYACGSMLALGTMLTEADDEDCSRITEEHNIASLLVNDIMHACNASLRSAFKESMWLEFECRFTLMVKIVLRESDAITESLLKDLWINVLSSSELDSRLRLMAWSLLAKSFDTCRVRNRTLDKLVERYLPNLSPALYESAVLDFAERSVKYEVRHAPIELMEPQDVVIIPGIERVWNIMLTAPPNTVELFASQFIIDQYLDDEPGYRQEPSSTEATHLALIDRCVQQVIDAASHLKSNSDTTMMDGIAVNNTNEGLIRPDFHAMRFHRSLLFLRKFLNNLKTKPRYAPAISDNLRKALSAFDKKGQIFEVTLQIIGHKSLANIQLKWTLGYDNSGVEVWQFLYDITGWSQFTVICGGKRLLLNDEQKTLKDLGIKPGSFIISKVQGSPENAPARALRASSPVDNKVMNHFDDLYNLLDLENQFSKEVFDFLSMFSSQEEVVQRLKSMSISADQLLPVEKPFKLMYYARALRSCIEEESFSSEPNTDFLLYGIRTILSVLPNLNRLKAEVVTCISIAQGLVEALSLGFRARVTPEVSKSYIGDSAAFSQNILALWSQALEADPLGSNPATAAASVRAPFDTLLEGLLHDERLWSTLSTKDLTHCLERSLLSHPLQEVRETTLEIIHGLTGVTSPKLPAKSTESRAPRTRFTTTVIELNLEHLWTVLLGMMQQANLHAATCGEYFDAVASVLRRYQPKLNETDLKNYIETWKTLLLAHQHRYFVGLVPQDFFISSLGKLLLQAIKTGQPHSLLTNSESFVRDLFSSFLFPPSTKLLAYSTSKTMVSQEQRDPVLDMHTRWTLYELILTLSHDYNNLGAVCDELDSDLIPKDFYFQPTTNNDRQSLRSGTGYSGLRNLSNTCYLNSLISQLFMNVEFRELVMNVNIIDHSKQKLVAELGKVFANMQMSYEEAVNPESAIDAITLWDGDQIDVTVQMDVDEFFNLLFDRLESQIVDPKVCSTFKAIYGGQLVQQIKSKECEHVSERLEPFTAVQVEIKGKASLEDSLRTYVEGEVLQGENKYSCTGCGKHVDAVKRACLKTVPNHLIFNLKRFDYDIMTGMRCKVNDEFGFPDIIDMAPYTLEALSNPEICVKQDMFELVGIIIHSGTAESGHYYSYIRQRPSKTCKEQSWVQFNDHDVTQFDPVTIKDCCFGGIDFGAIQCPKFYNGYMLFYQRTSSIQGFQRKYLEGGPLSPVRLPVDSDLENHISESNELVLRTYVAQDPVHAKFVRFLLQQNKADEQLKCLPKHRSTTSKLLLVALNYIHQLSARWKELPEFEETCILLRAYANDCVNCAQQIIKWLIRDDNLIDNLVRSCYVSVRKGFMLLIATCWSKWTESIIQNQQTSDADDLEETSERYMNTLRKFLAPMIGGWDHLQRFGRSWEQYFTIISIFLRTGDQTARLVIEAGFLEATLELVHVHVPSSPSPKRLRMKYAVYLAQRDRNRPFAHVLLIQLLADLLQHVDLVTRITDYDDRIVFEGRVSPTLQEASLLGMVSQPPNLYWLRKVIFGRCNPAAASQIVSYLCKAKQFDGLLCSLLREGLEERQLLSAIACLQPTITFLSCCTVNEIVMEMVGDALASIETTNGQYSNEFLKFVQEILRVSNHEASISEEDVKVSVKHYITKWAPVLLMAPNDIHADVRGETVELVNEVLFQDMNLHKQRDPPQYHQDMNMCKLLAIACATHADSAFINARAPTIHAGQASHVIRVVDHCLRFFGDSAGDEDEAARITGVMEDFRARSEGVVETLTDADWNASSDLEAMSEVDNISEASN